MDIVAFHAAKTHLYQLAARVEPGEEIILARRQPVAKRAAPAGRRFGALRGVVAVGPAFFEPPGEEELAAWE